MANDSSLLRAECKLVDFQKLKVGTPENTQDNPEFLSSVDSDCIMGVNNLINVISDLF